MLIFLWLISRIAKQINILERKRVCLACNLGYVLDQAGSVCTPAVTYCSVYNSGKCSICINGFFLQNNTCVRQSAECLQTDNKGLCTSCQQGFSVNGGLCLQDIVLPTCNSSQFLSSDYACVDGNIFHCSKYLSPSGQCASCDTNYTLNDQNQCVFTCPPNTATQKYVQRKKDCILTDINCLLVNDDGSCAVCNDGFYAANGICYSLSAGNQLTVDTSSQVTEQIATDASGNKYIVNTDGSSFYLTGPWTGLQVWRDKNGNTFVKVTNGGRRYLTGQYIGSVAYQDTNGNWYILNADGSKVYV